MSITCKLEVYFVRPTTFLRGRFGPRRFDATSLTLKRFEMREKHKTHCINSRLNVSRTKRACVKTSEHKTNRIKPFASKSPDSCFVMSPCRAFLEYVYIICFVIKSPAICSVQNLDQVEHNLIPQLTN